jgi:hypothetical protein
MYHVSPDVYLLLQGLNLMSGAVPASPLWLSCLFQSVGDHTIQQKATRYNEFLCPLTPSLSIELDDPLLDLRLLLLLDASLLWSDLRTLEVRYRILGTDRSSEAMMSERRSGRLSEQEWPNLLLLDGRLNWTRAWREERSGINLTKMEAGKGERSLTSSSELSSMTSEAEDGPGREAPATAWRDCCKTARTGTSELSAFRRNLKM